MKLYSYWRKFNEELAVRIVAVTATMECVYAFGVFVLIPLWFPASTPFVQYASSAFLQLTFLPLLLVAGDVTDRRNRAHLEAEHRSMVKEIKALRQSVSAMCKHNRDHSDAA